MNTRSFSLAVIIPALALVTLAGCYTQLMPFREAVAVRKTSMAMGHTGATGNAEVNYNDNCLSCHSSAELNDRAFDMDRAGLNMVHGVAYDPYGWQNPYTQPPWWNPYPIIEYAAPTGTGAFIPVTTSGGSGGKTTQPASPTNANRRRDTGSGRGDDGRNRTASPTTASPTPTTTTSGGGSTGNSSSAPVPVTTTSPTTTQAPPSQQTDTRTRSTNGSEDSRTRKSGSGRE